MWGVGGVRRIWISIEVIGDSLDAVVVVEKQAYINIRVLAGKSD